ncbi:hypothetical protein OROGR_000081 [Orobanche gracilis]
MLSLRSDEGATEEKILSLETKKSTVKVKKVVKQPPGNFKAFEDIQVHLLRELDLSPEYILTAIKDRDWLTKPKPIRDNGHLDRNKFCAYHKSSGHNTSQCRDLLRQLWRLFEAGSIEAIRQALQVLPQHNITLKFLLQATGDVNTSDIDLAVACKAIIFGFNVKITGSVKSYAGNRNVEIRMYKVIYELIDNMRNAMEGLLDPVEERVLIGSAEVRAVFSSGSSRVAGCMVTEGKVVKDSGIRVLRKGKEVHAGILNSLKRVKEMVKE